MGLLASKRGLGGGVGADERDACAPGGAAADVHDGALAPVAHVREESVRDVDSSENVRLKLLHEPFSPVHRISTAMDVA